MVFSDSGRQKFRRINPQHTGSNLNLSKDQLTPETTQEPQAVDLIHNQSQTSLKDQGCSSENLQCQQSGPLVRYSIKKTMTLGVLNFDIFMFNLHSIKTVLGIRKSSENSSLPTNLLMQLLSFLLISEAVEVIVLLIMGLREDSRKAGSKLSGRLNNVSLIISMLIALVNALLPILSSRSL